MGPACDIPEHKPWKLIAMACIQLLRIFEIRLVGILSAAVEFHIRNDVQSLWHLRLIQMVFHCCLHDEFEDLLNVCI